MKYLLAFLLVGCTTPGKTIMGRVVCPSDSGYYMGNQKLTSDVLELLMKAGKKHCQQKNKCLLAITDEEIICREDFSAYGH